MATAGVYQMYQFGAEAFHVFQQADSSNSFSLTTPYPWDRAKVSLGPRSCYVTQNLHAPFPSPVALPRHLPLRQSPWSFHSSLAGIQGLPNTQPPFPILGSARAFPCVWILLPPIVCLLRSRFFLSNSKAQLLTLPSLWTLPTASFQLTSPSTVWAAVAMRHYVGPCAQVCLSLGSGSANRSHLVNARYELVQWRQAYPLTSTRPFPCILPTTDPCLFCFWLFSLERDDTCDNSWEGIGRTGIEWPSTTRRLKHWKYPRVIPISSLRCF